MTTLTIAADKAPTVGAAGVSPTIGFVSLGCPKDTPHIEA